jgi:hypothetical protein
LRGKTVDHPVGITAEERKTAGCERLRALKSQRCRGVHDRGKLVDVPECLSAAALEEQAVDRMSCELDTARGRILDGFGHARTPFDAICEQSTDSLVCIAATRIYLARCAVEVELQLLTSRDCDDPADIVELLNSCADLQ